MPGFDDLPVVDAADSDLPGNLDLGAFSISLSVADLSTSEAFYAELGFVRTGGDGEQWAILRNGESMIGLFQGLFEGNILTFNPGLTNRMERLSTFTDVRQIQQRLDTSGVTLTERADSATSGPESITLVDPDGNAILIDQHL